MNLTYAIGDIHGRLDVLEACIAEVESHSKGVSAKIVFLGDYIDRGPDSRAVVDRLIEGSRTDTEWVVLGGNHEDMCLMAYHQPETHRNWWISNGGGATLASYETGEVADHHLYWMSQLPTVHQDDHRIFVHAGVMRDIPFEQQDTDHLRWIRHQRNDEVGVKGFYVVHGHTPYGDGPVVLETRCNLDTLSYRTGRAAVAVFNDALAGKPIDMVIVRKGYR